MYTVRVRGTAPSSSRRTLRAPSLLVARASLDRDRYPMRASAMHRRSPSVLETLARVPGPMIGQRHRPNARHFSAVVSSRHPWYRSGRSLASPGESHSVLATVHRPRGRDSGSREYKRHDHAIRCNTHPGPARTTAQETAQLLGARQRLATCCTGSGSAEPSLSPLPF